MSYIWMEFHLEAGDLRKAFERAVANEQKYLIHFGTSTNDFAAWLDEHTAEANDETLSEVIRTNYSKHDNIRVINVYDTSKAFEDAVMAQQPAAITEEFAAIKRDEHEWALAARPWWKKLLNMEP